MSEEEGGRLETDRLFKGLTRPAMIFGVSFHFAFLNFMLSFLAYTVLNNMKILFFVMPTMHMIAYVICFKEPLFVELFLMRAQKCSRCVNKMYHGANSYDVN